MNSRGQMVFYGFMLAVTIIVLALALAGPVMTATNGARDTAVNNGMDCANSSIDIYTKAACTSTDLTLPYFIGGLIAIAAVVLTAKIYFD